MRGFSDWNTGIQHGRYLGLWGAARAADNRARMAHALPFGGRAATDEADDRLGHMRLDVGCALFFIAAADLADHDNDFRIRVCFEEGQHVDEGRAYHRIAADPNAAGLSHAFACQFVGDLISQCTGAGDKADRTGLEDAAGNNADLAFAG